MNRLIPRAHRSLLGELWSLLALVLGMAGLVGIARAAGELLSILECSGAVGGGEGVGGGSGSGRRL